VQGGHPDRRHPVQGLHAAGLSGKRKTGNGKRGLCTRDHFRADRDDLRPFVSRFSFPVSREIGGRSAALFTTACRLSTIDCRLLNHPAREPAARVTRRLRGQVVRLLVKDDGSTDDAAREIGARKSCAPGSLRPSTTAISRVPPPTPPGRGLQTGTSHSESPGGGSASRWRR
jgi:hypothetical protein